MFMFLIIDLALKSRKKIKGVTAQYWLTVGIADQFMTLGHLHQEHVNFEHMQLPLMKASC